MKNGMIESTYTDDKTRKYYAWRASNYDALAEWEKEFHAEAVQLADAHKGQRVLVVACGTGRGMIGLAQAVGPTGRVDALDLSEAMIDQARAKSEKLGLSDRVHFKQGNARELPYPDETFDVVYNGYMFDLIPLDGFAPILKEMARVLKPGAPFIVTFSNRCFPTKAINLWLHTDDQAHLQIVALYFLASGQFDNIVYQDRSPGPQFDPLYAVWGRKRDA